MYVLHTRSYVAPLSQGTLCKRWPSSRTDCVFWGISELKFTFDFKMFVRTLLVFLCIIPLSNRAGGCFLNSNHRYSCISVLCLITNVTCMKSGVDIHFLSTDRCLTFCTVNGGKLCLYASTWCQLSCGLSSLLLLLYRLHRFRLHSLPYLWQPHQRWKRGHHAPGATRENGHEAILRKSHSL